MAACGGDQAGREVQNALNRLLWDGIVCACLANPRREHEAQHSAAGFFVRPHGTEQSGGRKVRPGRERFETANQRDNA